jgi:DNA polymerase I-like protein with 3'-5' exonuclease and polymerase domains/5'-3' exonuclease
MKCVFDLSSTLWTCLRAGVDKEAFEIEKDGKKHKINTAAYGYENAVNSIKFTLDSLNLTPIDAVFAVEGTNSKARRLMIFKDYKKSSEEKPVEYFEQFQKLREMIFATFHSLGSIFVTHDNVEGDDLVAWIAVNTREEITVRSNDQDLAKLYGKNQHGVMVNTWIGKEQNVNPYGLFPSEYITLYKAMVGDPGDKISGIPGFGKEAWKDFHAEFGEDGMAEMVRLATLNSLQELEDESYTNAMVKRIWTGKDDFLRSWKLANLHPEWLNTLHDKPRWEPGMVTNFASQDERLRKWSGKLRLVTADVWGDFVPWFRSVVAMRPWVALDIETSSADESEEWLENNTKNGNKDNDGVDVMGSSLTGMSLTFGPNMQYTIYIPVDHADTNNCTKDQVFKVLQDLHAQGLEIAIQNTAFEGPVMFNEFGERWMDNGYRGFLPNWLDTKLEASYVDENESLGLKKLSKRWLNYDQVDYKTATTVDGVQYKMNQLTAKHVFDYATDDTVTTAALHNFFKFVMNLEGTYELYKEVEIDAAYFHAQSYVTGVDVSLEKLAELIAEDDEVHAQASRKIDEFLISKGWDGTVCPVYTEIGYKQIKEAYTICVGELPESVAKLRTASKILGLLQDDQPLFVEACKELDSLNRMVASRFTAKPVFNAGSPLQMQKLMYETLGLPMRVFNPPTDAMKAQGLKQGNVKTDALAITYALLEATEEQREVLQALREVKLVATRRSLFYGPLPGFVHWKTGKVHSSHMQCGTNTRRAASKAPNLQQLSKHEKVEGYSPRVRELYVPHHKRAVIVSFDFKSQELLLMAEWSRDPVLVACFVGDNLIDMHSKTGVGVYNQLNGGTLNYEEFLTILADASHPENKRVKKARALGKAVNFGGQYRIGAKKLSTMLLVLEHEAQAMLDAKAEAFPIVEQWSLKEMEAVKYTGIVYTMGGAVRHLAPALLSEDRYTASKAPRQALSFRIQGSAAEMTKLAEGRMWRANLESLYDCRYIAPVHDEVVFSVAIEDLEKFIPHVHSLMTANYANMTLPIASSVSIGPDFGRQVELEGDFSLENVKKIIMSFREEPEYACA